ncbi:patatin-like phospholipase family protein [Sulfurimonas autotrophica]|uniref:Patatin n=1 Tax=Sulfurimonas autotrophica (strain ATCC BAA-671 / DSM 16294 / JCM 11897 / OK10) TaxID=563040 RepID=E0USH2_SULAO|nr:patatin-like phospholipase family protein [Sulfurimonas autotrophica]ADN09135.1 Patatin [Sulfurimonas autotrophica DSM 16294]
MKNNQFPKEIGLCLSGGAGRGAYHLGVISVLQENNIQIKAISGTSIGALIGASLACGKSAEYILEVIQSKEFRSVFQISLGRGYMFKLKSNAAVINKLIDKESFEELDIPLSVVACDVKNESAVYYNKGKVLKEAVLASCSIAPIFCPVYVNETLVVDGSLVDNFPVEQLYKYNYPILGINLFPKYKEVPKTMLGWLKKNIHTAWHSKYAVKKELCDIYLCNEELLNVKIFSFKDINKAYMLGREDMQKNLEKDAL